MNYVFFGTPEFAAIILKKLIESDMRPTAVICNPDRPVGRKKIITPPPTKILAQKYGIKVWQPDKLSAVGKLKPEIEKTDFAVVAAYSKILPKEIIALPRHGTIGVHPSLLPKYRGPTPIQSAILAGEKETGVTLFLIDEKIDHGKIIAQEKYLIQKNDNYSKLEKKLAEIGANLLIKNLQNFLDGKIMLRIQNENEASYTKKFTANDAYVNLEKDDPRIIMRKIRALNPEPGVYTFQNKKRVKLLDAELKGEILKPTKIQVEGKKPLVLNN